MDSKQYNAAFSGSFTDIRSSTSMSNWKEQTTLTGNNVLHVHLGKFLNKKAKHQKGIISIEFINKVLDDHGGTISGSSLIWKENSNGDTPLHVAARFGHKEVVEIFLERAKECQKEVTRMTNKNKDTALHEAARAGHADVVKLLVDADPKCPLEPNKVSETPLYLAAERGSTASVATIIDTCDPSALAYNYRGPCGRTALHAAAHRGDLEMVQKILLKDSRVVRVQDDEGQTPLHCAAAEMSKYKLLEELLKFDSQGQERSAVYIQDNKGRTPLHIAVLRCNCRALTLLITSCPDCIEIVDNNGQNVVHYAANWACITKLECLLSLGNFDKLLNDKDINGNTPLHLLAASIPDAPGQICLLRFEKFVTQSSLDPLAFNKQNLTVGDIMASYADLLRHERILKNASIRVAPRGRRINTYERDVDSEKAIIKCDVGETNIHSMKKVAQSRLVVAALISTVSFTAGFTLPGGFNQNTGNDMGVAVLKNKGSFQAFVISDAIAFTFSTLAVLAYFVLVSTDAVWAFPLFSIGALLLNTISLGALMVAFLAGVCSVLPQSNGIVSAICSISVVFFFCYIFLVWRNVAAVWYTLYRCQIRDFRVLQ